MHARGDRLDLRVTQHPQREIDHLEAQVEHDSVKILIAEDDPEIVLLMQKLLGTTYEVEVFADGLQAQDGTGTEVDGGGAGARWRAAAHGGAQRGSGRASSRPGSGGSARRLPGSGAAGPVDPGAGAGLGAGA